MKKYKYHYVIYKIGFHNNTLFGTTQDKFMLDIALQGLNRSDFVIMKKRISKEEWKERYQ